MAACNTVLASWLFCSLGKCILPTTFVLGESFLASKPPRRQHPTVMPNFYATQKQDIPTIISSQITFIP